MKKVLFFPSVVWEPVRSKATAKDWKSGGNEPEDHINNREET